MKVSLFARLGRIASCAVIPFVCVGAASAEETLWLGKTSAKWTDAANWSNGVPGWYKTADGDFAGDISLTAVFGAVDEGAATTIDISNLQTCTNVFFRAGAPSYTIGTSASQTYNPYCSGWVKVEEGVTNDQTFASCRPCKKGEQSNLQDGQYEKPRLANYGSCKLILQKFDNAYDISGQFWGAASGTIEIGAFTPSSGAYWANYSDGKIVFAGGVINKTWTKSLDGNSDASAPGPRQVVIPEGQYFSIRNSGGDLNVLYANGVDVELTGGGTFAFRNGTAGKGYNFNVSAGKKITCDCRILAGRTDIADGLFLPVNINHAGTGTVELRREMTNATEGVYKFAKAGTLRVPRIGLNDHPGEPSSPIGELDLLFAASGTVDWFGEGDVCDRPIGVANNGGAVTLKNSGSGELVYTGTITQSVTSATLCLNAANAPIRFAGTVATNAGQVLNLMTDGPFPVTVSNIAQFAKFNVNGQDLIFENEPCEKTMMLGDLSLGRAGSRLVVPEGVHLSFKGIGHSPSSATVDLIVPPSSTVAITGHAAGDTVEWVTMNGAQCYFTADGQLHAYLSEWKTAEGGDWREAEMWTDGVPDAQDLARLNATGADYTVAVNSGIPVAPARTIVGSGTDGQTVTLAVKSNMGLTNKYFHIEKDGLVSVDGADLILYGASYVTDVFRGGSIDVKNGGKLKIPSGFTIKTGSVTIGPGSGLAPNTGGDGRKLYVKPTAAGETAELTVNGTGYIYNGGESFLIGGTAGGTARVNFNGVDETTRVTGPDKTDSSRCSPIVVGHGSGLGEMNLTNGYVLTGNWGFHVGAAYAGSVTEAGVLAPTGVVNMSGGTISYSGWNNAASRSYCGLIIGDGALVQNAGNGTFCRGTLNLSGGTLTSNQGYLMIGVGPAEGELNQTGGSVDHRSTGWTSASYIKPDGTSNFVHDVYIGLAGATGRYRLSGGQFYAVNRVFVGGAPTNDLCRSTIGSLPAANHDGTRKDGFGLLSLQGGTFVTTTNVYVGAYGRGRLELGTNAYLSAKTLVLSNDTESVLSAALGDTGFGPADRDFVPVKLSGELVIAEGAKIEIDASGLTTLKGGRKRIVTAEKGVRGAFDASNVEIIEPTAASDEVKERIRKGTIVSDATGLFFRPAPQGLLMIVR